MLQPRPIQPQKMAGGDRRTDRAKRAQPTAKLDLKASLLDDLTDLVKMHRLAATRPVEIDDVKPLRTGLRPEPRRRRRLARIDGARVEVTLREPHNLPVEDVNRGVEDHAAGTQLETKFASSASPSSEDFSG